MIGQHIRVLKDGRWFHAVDCGDETILHLVEEAPPRVRRAYRPEFVAGANAVQVVLHRERTFPAKEIVRRAYSRASDPALASMFKDSEAFVEWCTTGRLGAPRNVAVEVPGVAGGAPAKARAAKAPAPKASAKPKVKAAAKTKAKPAAKPSPKAKAKPAVKAMARAKPARSAKARRPARKAKPAPRKPKAPAKRGARVKSRRR